MSDPPRRTGQKTRSPKGCDENGPAAALLLSYVSIQICSFVAPCRRPILIATLLYQSRTWCTSSRYYGGLVGATGFAAISDIPTVGLASSFAKASEDKRKATSNGARLPWIVMLKGAGSRSDCARDGTKLSLGIRRRAKPGRPGLRSILGK